MAIVDAGVLSDSGATWKELPLLQIGQMVCFARGYCIRTLSDSHFNKHSTAKRKNIIVLKDRFISTNGRNIFSEDFLRQYRFYI